MAARPDPFLARQWQIHRRDLHHIRRRIDWVFGWLLLVQWIVALALAWLVAPRAWGDGPHLQVTLVAGVLINLVPWWLIRSRPGRPATRHTIAVAQMVWSGLLIHLTGGRIETHFHVFGSLAFLAFYRDWRTVATATIVTLLDLGLRGALWPASLYGVADPSWHLPIEHAAWIAFEDVILIIGCVRGVRDLARAAAREAELEVVNREIDLRVRLRTEELEHSHQALADEMQRRLQAETELRSAQKLEAVGQLAAGIAHEINTPMQYISDNARFLDKAFAELTTVFDQHAPAFAGDPRLRRVNAVRERLPRALAGTIEGVETVTRLVRAMKEFSHQGGSEQAACDLNQGLRNTVLVARNEWKYVAEVDLELAPDLPAVLGNAAELNQVWVNLLVNAAHAVADQPGRDGLGRITITSATEGDTVVVRIRDTGPGVPVDIRDRIFEPFFTTKAVGRGSGQGLAIVRSIVERHGGQIGFCCGDAGGTTFTVTLPRAAPPTLTN